MRNLHQKEPDTGRGINFKKVSGIYKTIVSMGNPLPPAIIGLCEIENRFVLNQLVYKSPFSKMDYRIVHEESPDRRGTDVALLFDPERVELMGHQAINIQFPFSPETRTRDILYSKLLVFKEDTIHVFVNHWPSRWGGQMASAPKRNFVADILKIKTDSILNLNPNANIIILGDFNDEPDDESIRDHLYARSIEDSTLLVNLMASEHADKMIGSHKYRENWGTLDQVIISNCLLLPDHSIQVKNKKAHIFNASFLMENDETFVGLKPYRTFVGFKYNGGYSDHLPIYFDLFKVL